MEPPHAKPFTLLQASTVQSNWFKAGEITVGTLTAHVYDNNELSDDDPPVINTDYSVSIEVKKGGGVGSFMNPAAGEATREMKIMEDPNALVTNIDCLKYPQTDKVSGHAQINPSSVIDYQKPTVVARRGVAAGGIAGYGYEYGRISGSPTIKISQPGFYTMCYCDSMCNSEANWVVVKRRIVAGPLPGQYWRRRTWITFDLKLDGHKFSETNRILALDFSQRMSDCGTSVLQSAKFYYPTDATAAISSGGDPIDSNGRLTRVPAKFQQFTRDSAGRGTVIWFNARHGLVDGDQLTIENVKIHADYRPDGEDPTDLTTPLWGADPLRTEIENMFNSIHKVSVLCDGPISPNPDPINGCYKVLIPVIFSASEFPEIIDRTDPANPKNIAFDVSNPDVWYRTSEELFIRMRVSEKNVVGSRGYIICWAKQDAFTGGLPTVQLYKAPVGHLNIQDPPKMGDGKSWVSLTTIQPDKAGADLGMTEAPIIVTFETAKLSRYTDATKSLGLKLVFMNEEVKDANNHISYHPVVVPML